VKEEERIIKAIQNAYAVVTATGIAGAVAKRCPPDVFINSPALLANMGVEDEYGEDIPFHRVLAGKSPLNFILEEPTRLKYIEATMALHNEGAAYLATHFTSHSTTQGVIIPPMETEQKMLDITKRYGVISDELLLI